MSKSKCRKCDVFLNEFNTSPSRLKTYNNICTICFKPIGRKYQADWALKNPEKAKERSRKSKLKNKTETPIKYSCSQMRSSARKRAKKFLIPFDITTKHLITLAPEYCPVFNKLLTYGGGESHEYSPSLDRIIPEKGYVEGNVQIISNLANSMKNSANKEQLNQFADWVKENYVNVKRP